MRQLLLPPKLAKETQCYKLFQTKCVILDKVFDLFIDSGSQENIIAREIVEKHEWAIKGLTHIVKQLILSLQEKALLPMEYSVENELIPSE